MSDVIQFRIANEPQRRRDLFRLMLETKKDLAGFMFQWGGVLAIDCARWTPPRAKKAESESWANQRKRGENRIKYEVRRLYHDIRKIHILQQQKNERAKVYFDRYVSQKRFAALRYMLNSFGIKTAKILESATVQSHQQARATGKRGRVDSKVRYVTFDLSSVKSVENTAIKHVGRLKAGWVRAAAKLGRIKQLPGWVKQHSSEPGDAQLQLNGPAYRVAVINASPITKDHDPNAIVAPALAILERKMMKSLEAILRHKYGKTNRLIS